MYEDDYITIIEPKNDSRVYIDGKSKSFKKFFTRLKSDVYFGKVVSFKEIKDGYTYEILCDDTYYVDYRVYKDKNIDSKFNKEFERLYKIANSPKNIKKSKEREDALYTERKGIFKRNLVNYSGYGENLSLQVGAGVMLLLFGLLGNLLLTNIPFIIASTIILGRIGYVLYKTIDSTNKELKSVSSKTIYSKTKKEETKKEEVKTSKKDNIKVKSVSSKMNINKNVTLTYLKNEYKRLYLEREKLIKNNASKDEINAISMKMFEVGRRAYRMENEEVTKESSSTKSLKLKK